MANQSSCSDKLKLILVGMSGVGKSASGNTILRREEFESETSPSSLTLTSKGSEGEVCGRRVLVVDTPGLCNTEMSGEKLREEMHSALALRDHGPHAFLLVIQLGRFTQQEKRVMETLQELFPEGVNQRTMVLFTYGDKLRKKTIQEFISSDANLQQLLEKCGNRYHVFNNQQMEDHSQVSELLRKVDNMVASEMNTTVEEEAKERDIHHPTNSTRAWRDHDPHSQPTGSTPGKQQGKELRIMLVGKTGEGKRAAGNKILGREEFTPYLSSQHGKVNVDGIEVAVIDTPDININFNINLINNDIKQQTMRSISLSSPGPHVFLVVIHLGRFTQDEQNTVKIIQDTLGRESAKYTIVLFTHGDKLKKKTIEDFLSGNKELAEFIDQCRGGYHVFNNDDKQNHSQVSELMEKINKMVAINGRGYFTNENYREAEEMIKKEERRIVRERAAHEKAPSQERREMAEKAALLAMEQRMAIQKPSLCSIL